MNLVLLSGGSGQRLWPLSNDIRSKQFIKIFHREDGELESMVQRVYRQIKTVDTDATVTIATSKSQVSAIHNQLGEEVGISVEPCRRDTFPAIALAAAYLKDVQGVGEEESVVVCPVDPYVENDYFEALKALGDRAAVSSANLVLMGIEPTYPSEKYGYIIPIGKEQVSKVSMFKEKPTQEVAKDYIAKGALWNGGVFAFKLGYVLNRAHELIDFVDYEDLAEVLRAHPEYLGERHKGENTLPILIKFIDAKKDLSVQVHPTDAYAQEHENGQLGKTEMWYVLDASKDAKLVYGLKRERTEQQVRDAIAEGTLMKDLQWVPVKKDDLFFIEAGTIHAIGAGALVAEIQENSNLTYRLYDYDRVGKDGKKRELHVDKALDVANLKSSAEPRQPLRVLKYRQGVAAELLTRCKYFEVYRMIVNTERRQKVHYRADGIAFRVLLCVNGCGTISYDGGSITFYKGDCIFVPADSEVLTLHGQAQFLDVRG